MSEYVVIVPKRHFNLLLWNTTPSNTRIQPILLLFMPKNAHIWMTLHFVCVQNLKKKKKKIDLPTLPFFRPKGQANLLFFALWLYAERVVVITCKQGSKWTHLIATVDLQIIF